MRTIKFRAWDIRSKKYITDTFFVNCDGQTITVFPNGKTSEQYALFVGVDIIVEQFTGLYDKNGKEIYEGDIVNIYRASEYYDEEEDYNIDSFVCRQKVEWSDVGGYFCDVDTGEFCPALGDTDEITIEVIGNIYENPELINK